MQDLLIRAMIAGIVAVVFGLLATWLVQLVVPTPNLQWSMIAVGFASFFAGLAGYLSGYNRDREVAP